MSDNYAVEEYLTVDELSERIKYKKQSIYNLIYRRVFVLKVHYLKPSRKKLLFKWTEIIKWLGDNCSDQILNNDSFDCIENREEKYSYDKTNSERCRINI